MNILNAPSVWMNIEWIVKQILNEYRVTGYKGELFLIFYENIRVNSVELLLFKYALQIQNDGERKKKQKKEEKEEAGNMWIHYIILTKRREHKNKIQVPANISFLFMAPKQNSSF